MALADKACVTCRQKCRKCDRTQPTCRRCATKGLECGGYPEKFKFVGIASRGKWKGLEKPLPKHELPRRPINKESTISLPSSELLQQESQGSSDSSPSERIETPPLFEPRRMQLPEDEQEPIHRALPDVMIPKTNIKDLLALKRTEYLLSYYIHNLCPMLVVTQGGIPNPMREYILPLAYEHLGVLHGLLGLTACHMSNALPDDPFCKTEALKHRLEATRYLKELLAREAENRLPTAERDVVLATKNLLALQDIHEFGSLSQAIPLTIAARLCEKLMAERHQTRRTIFLLGSLATLDEMRSVSDPKTLRFSQESRRRLLAVSGPEFELVGGCNRELLLIFGDALEKAKQHSNGELSTGVFQNDLARCKRELQGWNADLARYPGPEPEWKAISEAYRCAFMLRVMRMPDPFALAAELPEIQDNVTKILDAASQVSDSSHISKRLLLPLFMAGADSLSGHQRHYISMRMHEINSELKFAPSGPLMLNRVWEVRDSRLSGENENVPWNINYL